MGRGPWGSGGGGTKRATRRERAAEADQALQVREGPSANGGEGGSKTMRAGRGWGRRRSEQGKDVDGCGRGACHRRGGRAGEAGREVRVLPAQFITLCTEVHSNPQSPHTRHPHYLQECPPTRLPHKQAVQTAGIEHHHLGFLQRHPMHLNCRFLDQRANRSDRNQHQVQSGDEGAG